MKNPDNMGFDRKGHLLIQEDPGNNVHRATIVAYDTKSGDRAVLAQFDNRFEPGSSSFITQDEESSGIIDSSRFLGSNTFLFDAQVHKPPPGRRQGRARPAAHAAREELEEGVRR